MKKQSLQMPFTIKGRLKNTQNGMTLIEVLISMFVLAIGVLALLSVQLRAVSGVREAENQTIVSQITQNLIEQMLVNPVLTAEKDNNTGEETGRVIKSYGHYFSGQNKKSSGSENKDNLATEQITAFRSALTDALPETQVFSSICLDNSGKDPVYENSGTFKDNCSGSGHTVIKVLWLTDAEEQSDNPKLTTSGNYIVYTHQSRVTE